jgi:hypothetical protein
MSVTVTTHLFCDNCHDWDEDIFVSGVMTAEHSKVRRIAKRRGWVRRKIEDKLVDLCPKCKDVEELS